ncbi:MAG TPA: M48 family metallopeptidase [Candidatus Hydrogenedens sp.]|nr:M48 family metallopeptidase [Candidatus Hydrogenedens sp.]
MFELVRQNKRRSIILAGVMLLFMLMIGYIIGAFLAYAYYFVTEPYAFSDEKLAQSPHQQYQQHYRTNYPQHPSSTRESLTYEEVQFFTWLYWGPLGAIVAFVAWFIQMIFAFYSGGNMLLSISNAIKIEKADHPQLFNIVEEMKIASRLPKMPEIYIIDDPAMNAFATGRSPEHCAVAVTRGLLNHMNRDQIQGVIAHEISHIVHRDTLYMTMLAVSLGTIILLVVGLREAVGAGIRGSARYSSRNRKDAGGVILFLIVVYIFALLLSLIAPFLAQLIYFACSRQREYLADAGSVVLTRNPEGLASALEAIAKKYQQTPPININQLTAPMYIINPLEANKLDASSIFSTHPPILKRIQILRTIARTPTATYEQVWQQIEGKKWKKKYTISTNELTPTIYTSVGGTVPPPLPLEQQMLNQTIKPPSTSAETTPHQNVRNAGDAIMKAQKFNFLKCSCGVILKIPPNYQGKIICPRCRTTHNIIKNPLHK